MTICGHLVTALMDLRSGSLLIKAAQVKEKKKNKPWELMSHINTPIKNKVNKGKKAKCGSRLMFTPS